MWIISALDIATDFTSLSEGATVCAMTKPFLAEKACIAFHL